MGNNKILQYFMLCLGVLWTQTVWAALASAPSNLNISGDIYDTTPAFSWSGVTGANYYRLAIKQGAVWVVNPEPLPVNTGYTLPPADALSVGQCYTWTVRAERAIGDYGPWASSKSFCVKALTAPGSQTPIGNTYDRTPSFSWSAVPGANYYRLAVKQGSVWVINPEPLPTFNGYTLTSSQKLTRGQCYTWYVRAERAIGDSGPWSSGKNLCISNIGVPTVNSPTTTIADTTPTFNWSSVVAANQYRLSIKHGTALVVSPEPLISTTNYTLSSSYALSDGECYSWSVRAEVDSADYGLWSAPQQFCVEFDTPPSITVTKPSGIPPEVDGGYLIQWSDADPDSNASISLYYDNNNYGFNGTLITSALTEDADGSGDTYYWNTNGIPSGTYYVYAKISDNTSTVYDYSSSPLIVSHNNALAKPINLSPSGNTVAVTPTFSWDPVTDANYYRLAIKQGSIWVIDPEPLPVSNSYTLTTAQALKGGQCYSWSVRAERAIGDYGPWSTEQNLCVTALGTPVANLPSTSAATTTPTFSWSGVSGAVYYRLAVKQGSVWVINPEPLPNTTSYTVQSANALEDGQCYSWNVRAERAIGDYGPWSTSKNFCVDTNIAPQITVLDPDGVNDVANASYLIRWTDSDPDDNATISLYYDTNNSGVNGTLIVSGLNEDSDGSGDEYLWNTSNVPAGSYYVYAQITDGSGTVTDYSPSVVSIVHNSNAAPSITLIEPYGNNDNADQSFEIRWNDSDPDDNATIALYYDTNNSGSDGFPIVTGLQEDGDGPNDLYTWNTTAINNGSYYVYAVISDGTSTVTNYSLGRVNIFHSAYHSMAIQAFNKQVQDQWNVLLPHIRDELLANELVESISLFDINTGPGLVDLTDEAFTFSLPAQGDWAMNVRLVKNILGDHVHANVQISNMKITIQGTIDNSDPLAPKLLTMSEPDIDYDFEWSSGNPLVHILDFIVDFNDIVDHTVKDAVKNFTGLVNDSLVGGPQPYGGGQAPLQDPGSPSDGFLANAASVIDANIQNNHFYPQSGIGSILTSYYPQSHTGNWQQAIQEGYSPGLVDIDQADNFGDSAIWTGHYLAAMAFQLASIEQGSLVDFDPIGSGFEGGKEGSSSEKQRSQALISARRAIAGLDLLSKMRSDGTNFVGLLNRAIIPINGFIAQSQLAKMFPSIKDPYAHQFEGQWYVMSDRISRDQYEGVFFGLATAYKLVPELRGEVTPIIERLLDYLSNNNWIAEHTQQSYINGNGAEGPIATSFAFHTAQQLAWIQVGMMVNPGKYQALWDEKRYLTEIAWFPVWATSFDSINKFFKFNLETGALYTYLTIDQSNSVERDSMLRAFRIMRRLLRHHDNAYFGLAEHSIDPGQVDLPEIRALIRLWLQRPVRHQVPEIADSTAIQRVQMPGESQAVWRARYPLLPQERPITDYFLWQRTSFDLGQWASYLDPQLCILRYGPTPGAGYCMAALNAVTTLGEGKQWHRNWIGDLPDLINDEHRESPGLDYLLAFWMAKYIRVLP